MAEPTSEPRRAIKTGECFVQRVVPCYDCGGKGHVGAMICDSCLGGVKRFTVDVPLSEAIRELK